MLIKTFFSIILLFGSVVALAEEQVPATTIVIFGATGDLTQRKIIPALYHLIEKGFLSEKTLIVGIGRKDYENTTFREKMRQEGASWQAFEKRLFYYKMDFEQEESYKDLRHFLLDLEKKENFSGNRLYYLATAQSFFSQIVKQLHDHPLVDASRFVLEKPFGYDLDSALRLQQELAEYLDEKQLYLIDHYLAKQGVQNLLNLRFEQKFFEPLWNKEHIDNVQITISEEMGIGSRGKFWEETGLIRDIFQNHLMQLLTLVAMEAPSSLTAEKMHAEKIKLLDAIRPISLQNDPDVAYGQYGAGKTAVGYREEKGVPADSSVETFAAAKLWIDNKRWEGVPFYLRAGKRLAGQTVEIAVTFKHFPHPLFIRIQPDSGIFFKTKVSNEMSAHSMEGYERLLYDSLRGDKRLFVQTDEIFSSWRLLTPVMHYLKNHPLDAPNYDAFSWGPSSARDLLEKDGRSWKLLEEHLKIDPIKELLSKRYSGYAYDPKRSVSDEQLQLLIKAASLAPSSYNEQPWHFIICNRVLDEEAYNKALSTLVPFNQEWAKQAPVLIVSIAASKSGHNQKVNRWGEYDTGAAAFSIMLQATSLGLMAHQMGGFDEIKAREVFEIPEGFTPMTIMAVGYPLEDGPIPEKKRKPFEANMFLGKWNQ